LKPSGPGYSFWTNSQIIRRIIMETAKIIVVGDGQERIFVKRHGYLTPDEIVKRFYTSRYACGLNLSILEMTVIQDERVRNSVRKFEMVKYRAEMKARWDRNKRMGRKFVNKH
jgi:hypothetical protein